MEKVTYEQRKYVLSATESLRKKLYHKFPMSELERELLCTLLVAAIEDHDTNVADQILYLGIVGKLWEQLPIAEYERLMMLSLVEGSILHAKSVIGRHKAKYAN